MKLALILVSAFAGFSFSQAYLLYDDEASYLAGRDSGIVQERAFNEYCSPLSELLDRDVSLCIEKLYDTDEGFNIVRAYKAKRGNQ